MFGRILVLVLLRYTDNYLRGAMICVRRTKPHPFTDDVSRNCNICQTIQLDAQVDSCAAGYSKTKHDNPRLPPQSLDHSFGLTQDKFHSIAARALRWRQRLQRKLIFCKGPTERGNRRGISCCLVSTVRRSGRQCWGCYRLTTG